MNIFKEAYLSKKNGMGYRARRFYHIWKSKEVGWNNIRFEYGIRWSDKWQLFPIWNSSHNSQRSLLFGIWKLYFEIAYYRKGHFNHNRKLPFQRQLSNFYRLIA